MLRNFFGICPTVFGISKYLSSMHIAQGSALIYSLFASISSYFIAFICCNPCSTLVDMIFADAIFTSSQVKSSQTLFLTREFTMINNTIFNSRNKHRNKNNYNSSNQKRAKAFSNVRE